MLEDFDDFDSDEVICFFRGLAEARDGHFDAVYGSWRDLGYNELGDIDGKIFAVMILAPDFELVGVNFEEYGFGPNSVANDPIWDQTLRCITLGLDASETVLEASVLELSNRKKVGAHYLVLRYQSEGIFGDGELINRQGRGYRDLDWTHGEVLDGLIESARWILFRRV